MVLLLLFFFVVGFVFCGVRVSFDLFRGFSSVGFVVDYFVFFEVLRREV